MRRSTTVRTLIGFIAAAGIGVIAGATSAPTATSAPAAKVGSPAPEFKLPDLEGKEISLAEFKGKTVILGMVLLGMPMERQVFAQKCSLHRSGQEPDRGNQEN